VKFIDHHGIARYRNIRKHLINWDNPSISKFQTKVKKFLYPYWKNHSVYEELPVIGTKNSVDFYNATRDIVIEVQGIQHTQFNKFMHNKSRSKYVDQIKRDMLKMEFAERNGFKFIEIYPADLPLTEEFFYEKFGIFLI